MEIDLEYGRGYAVVTRETDDPKYYRDTTLFHAIKKKLIARGHNVIKKLAWKDGNLVDSTAYWLRSRNPRQARSFALWWGYQALRPAYEDFNEGKLPLQAMWDLSVPYGEEV